VAQAGEEVLNDAMAGGPASDLKHWPSLMARRKPMKNGERPWRRYRRSRRLTPDRVVERDPPAQVAPYGDKSESGHLNSALEPRRGGELIDRSCDVSVRHRLPVPPPPNGAPSD